MYNLMMAYAPGTWEEADFILERFRYLEHTAQPLADRYSTLDDGVIHHLKSIPTLFAYEERGSDSDSGEIAAKVGRILDIQIRYGGIRTTWQFDQQIPPITRNSFRGMYRNLDIAERNWEHTRTHWAVKDVDLYEALELAGIARTGGEQRPPRVFVSYSWDSQDHQNWVRSLCQQLRASGIDAIADFSHVRPGEDLMTFMEQSDTCDRVIVVCTENYMRRATDRRGGVGYEHLITASALMNNLASNKYVPVIKNMADAVHMPPALRGRLYIDLSDGPNRNTNFQMLLRDLHGEPPNLPPLGQRPIF